MRIVNIDRNNGEFERIGEMNEWAESLDKHITVDCIASRRLPVERNGEIDRR